jgi:hypothetical protein
MLSNKPNFTIFRSLLLIQFDFQHWHDFWKLRHFPHFVGTPPLHCECLENIAVHHNFNENVEWILPLTLQSYLISEPSNGGLKIGYVSIPNNKVVNPAIFTDFTRVGHPGNALPTFQCIRISRISKSCEAVWSSCLYSSCLELKFDRLYLFVRP